MPHEFRKSSTSFCRLKRARNRKVLKKPWSRVPSLAKKTVALSFQSSDRWIFEKTGEWLLERDGGNQ